MNWYAIGTNIREQDGRLVARVVDEWHGMIREPQELGQIIDMIRAAPEMLAALQQILCHIQVHEIPPFAGLDKVKNLVSEVTRATRR